MNRLAFYTLNCLLIVVGSFVLGWSLTMWFRPNFVIDFFLLFFLSGLCIAVYGCFALKLKLGSFSRPIRDEGTDRDRDRGAVSP
jgi:hypothetical protein